MRWRSKFRRLEKDRFYFPCESSAERKRNITLLYSNAAAFYQLALKREGYKAASVKDKIESLASSDTYGQQ